MGVASMWRNFILFQSIFGARRGELYKVSDDKKPADTFNPCAGTEVSVGGEGFHSASAPPGPRPVGLT